MTWEELERLAATNAVVATWMHMYRHGEVTREQMLIGLAVYLARQNAELINRCVELSLRLPSPPPLLVPASTANDGGCTPTRS